MEKAIRAALIDDEQRCIDNLKHYLHLDCSRLEVVATASSAVTAIDVLNSSSIDIAFLDIHLFDQNIFDFLPQLNRRALPLVFVSAYSQYALQAFQVLVLDYLVKPIDRLDVQRCYEKILHNFNGRPALSDSGLIQAPCPSILLKQGEQVFNVRADSIVLLKAIGFYTEVVFVHKGSIRKVVQSKPLLSVAQQFDSVSFLQRVHRSHVINTQYITAVRQSGRRVEVDLKFAGTVPVAKRRASEFLNTFHA